MIRAASVSGNDGFVLTSVNRQRASGGANAVKKIRSRKCIGVRQAHRVGASGQAARGD